MATEIAVGADGTVAILGSKQNNSGYSIFKHNKMGGWNRVRGKAVKIAVDRDGIIWAVTRHGMIFKQSRYGQHFSMAR